MQEKTVADLGNHNNKTVPSTTSATTNTTARIPTNSPNIDRQKQDKAKAAISTNNPNDARTTEVVLAKKKIKRKPESELTEVHAHPRPEKLTAVQGEEKHKPPKQVAGPTQKSNNLQPTVSSSSANATTAVVALPPPPPSSENPN